MRHLLLAGVVLATLAVVSAQPPIPIRGNGFARGGGCSAPIQMDMFIDPLCPDCAATWPVVNQVVAHYGASLQQRVHVLPLPWHIWSHSLSMGAMIVQRHNASAVYPYLDWCFANQAKFWNDPTSGLTGTQVLDSLASAVDAAGFVPKATFAAGLKERAMDVATRVSWKYATSKGVYGTPQYHINGVAVRANEDWTFQQWRALLDPLLAAYRDANGRLSTLPGQC